MSRAKVAGGLIFTTSILFAAFYIAWFFGLVPLLDPDLAVKVPMLLIVMFLCFAAAWIGWIMLTALPRPVSDEGQLLVDEVE